MLIEHMLCSHIFRTSPVATDLPPPTHLVRRACFVWAAITFCLLVGCGNGAPPADSLRSVAEAKAQVDALQREETENFQARKQKVLGDIDTAIAAKDFELAKAIVDLWKRVQDDDLEKRKPIVAAGYVAGAPKREAAKAAEQLESLAMGRENFARQTEDAFLSSGVDVSAKAVGKGKATLELHYPLAGKVFMYQLGHHGVPEQAASMGFEKIVVYGTDGTYTMPLN